MTITTDAPATTSPTPTPPKRSLKPVFAGIAVAIVAALLGGAWWLGLLTPEPEAVSLASTVQAVQAESEAEAASTEEAAEPVASEPEAADAIDSDPVVSEPAAEDSVASEPASEPAAEIAETEAAGIAGTWAIATSDATFAGYRADSQVGEAVGRTPGVTGSLDATGTQITGVNITVDMTQLTSDSSLRDEHLGDEGIEYNTYPTSTFELTEPIDITTVPAEGVAASFQAMGNLTVREITLPVVINLEGTLVGDQLVVAGSADINLDDYGASVSSTDTAVMEFSLVFTQ